ncbi:hypothetical protein ABW19_dt0203371 [Dactylella cylindrospora]|nr:hypothetical protein ABW19_dt0203371 [Dactylella cylindrospora]
MDTRRGNYRGSSSRGSSDRGGRGGSGRGNYSNDRSHRDSNHQGSRDGGENSKGGQQHERPKKEAILDLAKYMDKRIIVKFSGGREVTGALKGYDQLMNLVLDEVKETMKGILFPVNFIHYHRKSYATNWNIETADDEGNEQSRDLGLVVARGPLLVLISPVDGTEQIENPFLASEQATI